MCSLFGHTSGQATCFFLGSTTPSKFPRHHRSPVSMQRSSHCPSLILQSPRIQIQFILLSSQCVLRKPLTRKPRYLCSFRVVLLHVYVSAFPGSLDNLLVSLSFTIVTTMASECPALNNAVASVSFPYLVLPSFLSRGPIPIQVPLITVSLKAPYCQVPLSSLSTASSRSSRQSSRSCSRRVGNMKP